MAKRVGRLLTGTQLPSDDADLARATRGPISNERDVTRQMDAAVANRKPGGGNRDYTKRPLQLTGGRSMSKGRR